MTSLPDIVPAEEIWSNLCTPTSSYGGVYSRTTGAGPSTLIPMPAVNHWDRDPEFVVSVIARLTLWSRVTATSVAVVKFVTNHMTRWIMTTSPGMSGNWISRLCCVLKSPETDRIRDILGSAGQD